MKKIATLFMVICGLSACAQINNAAIQAADAFNASVMDFDQSYNGAPGDGMAPTASAGPYNTGHAAASAGALAAGAAARMGRSPAEQGAAAQAAANAILSGADASQAAAAGVVAVHSQ